MARKKDWLPVNHEAFHALVQRLTNYIMDADNRDRMDFGATTNTGKVFTNEVVPAVARYLPVYNAWVDPAQRTKATQRAIEREEKALRALLRKLYKSSIKDSYFVTDEDLANMGLPPRHEGGGKPSPVARRAPGIRHEALDGHRVQVDFFDIESENKRGKPAGQHGIEFKIGVFDDDLPVTPEELTVSVFDTNPPYVFEGTAAQKGKFLKLFGRWENTRGEKGPWSDLFIVVIP